MRDASDDPTDIKEEVKPTPKLLWSDLIENDRDLKDALPHWYGTSTTKPAEGMNKGMKPSQPVSIDNEP